MSKGKTIVAVIDGGGRGSALIDKYAGSPKVDELIAIPGNDLMGINTKKPVRIFPHLKTTSLDEILKLCRENNVSLVDIAQDNAIEAGVASLLRQSGLKVMGASKEAGQIEWDKAYSRELLKKTHALQPGYAVFESEKAGIAYINSQPDKPRFIKAYGLVEGKGALPALNNKFAIQKIKELKRFGSGGKKYLIEDWLMGEEFSAFALSDANNFQMLGFAQDHKRVFDQDTGENTGGMGCSTPPLVVTEEIEEKSKEIISEVLEELKKEGRPYQGIIYLGGIVVNDGGTQKVYVIEFNARWGDPEAECILPGIQNDWYEVGLAIAENKLNRITLKKDKKFRVVVAGTSKGYPGDYSNVKGKEIFGIDEVLKLPNIKFYSAGIKKEGLKYSADGGRLFYIVGEGKDVIEARDRAYAAIKLIRIEGDNLHYRTDIGYRDVNRLKGAV
jgi:phosphoribosylamine---glycine ligase